MLAEVLERHLRQIQAAHAPKVPQPVVFAPASPADAPSVKQVEYFKMLMSRKQLPANQFDTYTLLSPNWDKRAMTSAIQYLVSLPWIPYTPTPKAPTLPADKIDQGYYAVNDPIDGVLKFYQVRAPKQGKWAGYHFLSQVSGDNKLSIRDKVERHRIFTEIAKDTLGALMRFGKEIGQCGHCRKQLTDEVSREFGIGPVCRTSYGASWR
jgi:hypothetical protein